MYENQGIQYPKESVEYGGTITMAGIENVPIPKNPELCLELLYGDWKTPRYLDKGNQLENGRPMNDGLILKTRKFFKKIGLYF